MFNKDKRSLLLSLVLGDGCLHYINNHGKQYGGLTIDHGIQQADYQSWKAELISKIVNRNVRMRTGHRGNSVQLSVCMKRFRAWRKFCYPNKHKSIPKLLRFINHPEFALTVWLMDDGYVEGTIFDQQLRGARFRLFVCSQTPEECQEILHWIKTNFDIDAKIRFSNKQPFIVFKQADSLKLWHIMRSFVLQFKSMQYKFRYIEQIYQLKCIQRSPGITPEDIVRS